MKRLKLFIKILFFLQISFLIPDAGFCQNKKTDSLLNLLKSDKEDTNKVNHLNNLSSLFFSFDPDSTILLANQAKLLAQKIHFKKGEAIAYGVISVGHRARGEFANALENSLMAIKINTEINNKTGLARELCNTGNIFAEQGQFSKALDFYFSALKKDEEIHNENWKAVNYGNLGNIYDAQMDYSKALLYYHQSLKIHEQNKNKTGIATQLGNIGVIYEEKASEAKSRKDKKGSDSLFRKALVYYFRAIKISEEVGHKNIIQSNLGNIGIVYREQGDFSQALVYYFKALELAKEIGDKNGTTWNLYYVGDIYTETKKYAAAEKYLFNALALGNEIGAMEIVRNIETSLSNLYIKTNKFQLALEHQKKATILKDSLFNIEKNKEITRKEMNYEFEKKEAVARADADKQFILAAKEKKEQQMIIYAVAFVLVIVILFSVSLYRRFKITQKQKQIIEIQKDEVSLQKHLVEEHQKEIIDSINYAERIQRSFIATKEILDENLNDYFVIFKPKDIVSGDFYWADKLNNGNFAMATADSTGHGVPGAIMSLLNITSLEKAIETHSQPSDILNATRKTIIERLKKDGSEFGGKDGMDASLAVYDFKNKKLTVAAANNPVWIVRGTEVIEIKADKMPVGKHDKDNVSFTQQEVNLLKGDVVYTLTDGFPDQFGGEKGKKFMSKNLRELLAANAQLPMSEQKQLLEKTFSDWAGNLEQVDDVTLIGVRI